MTLGPIEMIMIAFPDGNLDPQVAPALKELVDTGTIRIVDLLFVSKDAQGTTTFVELDDSGIAAAFQDVDGEVLDLINADDVASVTQELPNGSAAALIVWEDTWATKFADAVRASNGRVVANTRIPSSVVEAAMQAAHDSMAEQSEPTHGR